METNQTGVVSKRVFACSIIVLFLINSFTLYFFMTNRSQKEELWSQQASLQEKFQRLSDTLYMRNDAIEQFKGKTAELDKSIAEKVALIEIEKKEIKNLFSKNKMTQAELSKARDLVAQYQMSISDMGAKVEELTRQNQALTAKNGQLNIDLSLEKSTTGKLTELNRGLSRKVEVGSLLPIANLDVEAVKHRMGGKEVAVKRAKVAESLRISFETGNNKVIEPGPLSVYVRIINPKGEIIAVTDQGSGTILSSETPDAVQYTKKADFDYNQSNKKVVVYWNQNIKTPGTYIVELYQNGYVIGQSKVILS